MSQKRREMGYFTLKELTVGLITTRDLEVLHLYKMYKRTNELKLIWIIKNSRLLILSQKEK